MADATDNDGPDSVDERAEFEKQILSEAPRLGLQDKFKFA